SERVALGDQAGAAAACQVDPEPGKRDGEPAADADQEEDVGDAPHPPGQAAAEADPAEIDHGGTAADRGETALVTIAERPRGPVTAEPGRDRPADMAPLLLVGGSDAGHRLAVGHHHRRVADDENVGSAGYGKVRLDLDPAGPVSRWQTKPGRRRRSLNARRPHHRRG